MLVHGRQFTLYTHPGQGAYNLGTEFVRRIRPSFDARLSMGATPREASIALRPTPVRLELQAALAYSGIQTSLQLSDDSDEGVLLLRGAVMSSFPLSSIAVTVQGSRYSIPLEPGQGHARLGESVVQLLNRLPDSQASVISGAPEQTQLRLLLPRQRR